MYYITKWAIENGKLTCSLLLILCLFGVYGYIKSPKSQDPPFIGRTAQVITLFPGASAERVETLVTDRLEEALMEMSDVKSITSSSYPGMSILEIKLAPYVTQVQPKYDQLRRKVERAQSLLPHGVATPVVNDEFIDVYGTILTISSPGLSYKQLEDLADEIKRDISLLPDVGKVERLGIQKRRLYIEAQDAKIRELGFSSEELRNYLASTNIVEPGGEIVHHQSRFLVEPTGNFNDLEELKNLTFYLPDTQEVLRLRDIAHVYEGFQDPVVSQLFLDGVKSVGLAISLRDGGQSTRLGDQLLALVENLHETYPTGIHFDLVLSEPEVVEAKMHLFLSNLFQSMLFVVAISILFLGWRLGLLVASLIPLTVFITLGFLYALGHGVHQIVIGGLIISLGLIVDNAVVVTESVLTKKSLGLSTLQGCLESTQELYIPLLTSSLTTSLAFMPMYLAQSDTGEYVSAFFIVITISLLVSWVLAFTWIPTFACHILPDTLKVPVQSWSRYQNLLRHIFRYKRTVLLLFFLMALSSPFLFQQIPSKFFPEDIQPVVTVEMTLPAGTSIEQSLLIYKTFESLLDTFRKEELIKNSLTFVGGGVPRYLLNVYPLSKRPETIFTYINATDPMYRQELIDRIYTFCQETFPYIHIRAETIRFGTTAQSPIGVTLHAHSYEQIYALSRQVQTFLHSMPGVYNVRDNWNQPIKQLKIRIDQARAYRAGLTNRDVAISLQTKLSGFVAGEFREEDELIPIVIRSVDQERNSIDRLKTMTIYSQTHDANVPLMQIADIELAFVPGEIHRRHRQRATTILADFDPNQTSLQQINDAIETYFAQNPLPKKAFWEYAGEKKESNEASASLYDQFVLPLCAVFLLLLFQFHSYRFVFMILFTIPLATFGVALGFLATNTPFGFMALLGCISLAGIIINHAIVLIEQTLLEIPRYLHPIDAILYAANIRILPIIITSVTTIFGLTPLLYNSILFFEMSLAIIVGLTLGSLCTLLFIPTAMYVWGSFTNKR